MDLVRKAILSSMGLLLALGPIPAQTSAGGAPKPSRLLAEYSSAIENLAQSASPAVVQILVRTLAPMQKGESQPAGFVSQQRATGSGVIVDASGYILTNAHVVQGARHIDVQIIRGDKKDPLPHRHTVPAKLIGLDRQVDLAVIKIEEANLPALAFLDSDKLRQGQLVVALGSPLGLQNSLTHGVVSAVARQLKPESPMVYIQTDAPINPGNSGGPLVDIEGRIAGINTMILSESGGSEGIGFAIPANLAKDVYLKLRKDGRIRHGAIGVIPASITTQLGAALGLDRESGVLLSDVTPRSSAEAAGLQPGDIVLTIDGKPIREMRDLALSVFLRAPGEKLTIEVARGNERKPFTVAVLERDEGPGRLEDLANYDAALVRQLGILAVSVDAKVIAILPNLRRLSGVAVVAVPAEYAGLNPGLQAGDVLYALNNRRLGSIDDLRNALAGLKSGDPIALQVERYGQLIYVTTDLD